MAVALIHVTALSLAAVDFLMPRCRMRLWIHLLRCWSQPYPPNAGYSRVWVRGLSLTCQRVYPARFMGARHTPPTCQRDWSRWCHWSAFVEMGCRLYIAGSAAGYTLLDHRGAPLTNATHVGRDGPFLRKLSRRKLCTIAAACINSPSSIEGFPVMQIFCSPCRLTGAHWSGCQWGVSIW